MTIRDVGYGDLDIDLGTKALDDTYRALGCADDNTGIDQRIAMQHDPMTLRGKFLELARERGILE